MLSQWKPFCKNPTVIHWVFEHKAAFQTGSRRFWNENGSLSLPLCPFTDLSGSLGEMGTALQANIFFLYCYFYFSFKLIDKKITRHFVRRLQRAPSHCLYLVPDTLNKCFL